MPRRPEPLQTTRMLGLGFVLWFINAAMRIISPTISSAHVTGLWLAILDWTFWGGLLFLSVGMFLRATAWAQAWRDGTDGPYDFPTEVVRSENPGFPAEDDPDF
jgi:hypothetical protein